MAALVHPQFFIQAPGLPHCGTETTAAEKAQAKEIVYLLSQETDNYCHGQLHH